MLLFFDRLEPAEQAHKLAQYLPSLRQPLAVHFRPTMPAAHFQQAVTDYIGASAVRYPTNSPAELQQIRLYRSHILDHYEVEGYFEKARTPAPEPAVAMESSRQQILRLREKNYTRSSGIAAVLQILSEKFGSFAIHGTCVPDLAYVFDFYKALRPDLPEMRPPPARFSENRPRQRLVSPEPSSPEPRRLRSGIFRRPSRHSPRS